MCVVQDPGKEDAILKYVLPRDPKSFFGYASAQSLEHALHGDVQRMPGDNGDLVLVDAAPGVLALGVQYHQDGGPDKRPPSIKIFCQFLALPGLQVVWDMYCLPIKNVLFAD